MTKDDARLVTTLLEVIGTSMTELRENSKPNEMLALLQVRVKSRYPQVPSWALPKELVPKEPNEKLSDPG